ncbi:MAG: hypothetical protein MUF75_12625 [Bacteroidia bacterium]|jgi:hypothetical protein|nr:hypothetical protein [Bacteroidia bacterium]
MSASETKYLSDTDFSIINGGLFDRFLKLAGISKPGVNTSLRKIVFYTTIGWLPLAILTAVQGLFLGNKVDLPFLNEFAIHIRLLPAIWLLVMAEGIVDARVKHTIRQFNKSGILSEAGKHTFEQAKKKADRMCESYWAEGVILFLIAFNLILRVRTNATVLTTWGFPDGNNPSALSLAGYWAAFVSLPLFQFVVMRWFWRWIIWFRLLLLIAKADLKLLVIHPDKSGGLGFLGESPLPFSMFTFALSVIFSAVIAERVVFQGFILEDHYALIGAFVVLCVIINVAPLLMFVGPLRKARIRGLSSYHALTTQHHHAFQEKWIDADKKQQNELLGHPDASSAADLSTVYQLAESMTVFPFNIKTMGITVVISILPILAVFALQLPFSELLKMLAGILL